MYIQPGSDGVLFMAIIFVILVLVFFLVKKSNKDKSLTYTLEQIFNPYFNKHRKYAAILTVATSESDAFNLCASALHSSDWKYDLHRDLGKIIALRPYRLSWLSSIFENMAPLSFGVDILVEVEPLEAGETMVAISTESRRGGCITLGQPSWDEKWHYEAKIVAEQLFSTLITILDRKGIGYSDFTVMELTSSTAAVENEGSLGSYKTSDESEREKIEKYGVDVVMCPSCNAINSLSFVKCNKCSTSLAKEKPVHNPYL